MIGLRKLYALLFGYQVWLFYAGCGYYNRVARPAYGGSYYVKWYGLTFIVGDPPTYRDWRRLY